MQNNSKANLKETAYNLIKKRIITCELMPGEIVDQNALMNEIGVSKTPIREAINTLEQDGLLVVMPRRCVIVSHISINDIRNIYTVREALEPLIARLATPNVEMEQLKKLRDIFSNEKNDERLFFENDFLLHRYLAEKSGNPYLFRLMDTVLSQNLRIVVLAATKPGRLSISNQEHLKIIDRMLKRDAQGAEAAMKEHIDSARMSASAVNLV